MGTAIGEGGTGGVTGLAAVAVEGGASSSERAADRAEDGGGVHGTLSVSVAAGKVARVVGGGTGGEVSDGASMVRPVVHCVLSVWEALSSNSSSFSTASSGNTWCRSWTSESPALGDASLATPIAGSAAPSSSTALSKMLPRRQPAAPSGLTAVRDAARCSGCVGVPLKAR